MCELLDEDGFEGLAEAKRPAPNQAMHERARKAALVEMWRVTGRVEITEQLYGFEVSSTQVSQVAESLGRRAYPRVNWPLLQQTRSLDRRLFMVVNRTGPMSLSRPRAHYAKDP